MEQVKREQAQAARALRARYGGSVVLKSATSVLIADDGEAINRFGTPAMAKAGSGDALAGILGALLAGQTEYGLQRHPPAANRLRAARAGGGSRRSGIRRARHARHGSVRMDR